MAENHEWVFRHFCSEVLVLGKSNNCLSCHHDLTLSYDAPDEILVKTYFTNTFLAAPFG